MSTTDRSFDNAGMTINTSVKSVIELILYTPKCDSKATRPDIV